MKNNSFEEGQETDLPVSDHPAEKTDSELIQFSPAKPARPKRPLPAFAKKDHADPPAEAEQPQDEDLVIIQMPKNPLEDRPLKSATGGYNFDKLDQMKDDYVPSKRSQAKKVENPPSNDQPENHATPNKEMKPVVVDDGAQDRPLKPSAPAFQPPKEEPISGNGNDADELLNNFSDKPAKPKPERLGRNPRLVKPKQEDPPADTQPPETAPHTKEAQPTPEQPLPTNFKSSPEDDRPLGSKAGEYNFDNVDAIKDTYVPSSRARANKPTPAPPVTKPPEPSEDRPVASKTGEGNYNLDNLEEMEKNYKPSGKAPINKKPTPAPAPELTKPVNNDDQPIGQKTGPMMSEFPDGGKEEPPVGGGQNPGGDDGGIDADATLEGRLKNPNFAIKMQAYEDVMKWQDESVTPDSFCKALHFTIKEKHPQVLDKILTIIESIIANHPASWPIVNFKQFLVNFGEHLMSNVKGPSKDHSTAFIPTLWQASKKEEFLATLKDEMLKKAKVKLQENSLAIVLELVKAGKIEELGYFKPIKEELENLIVSRSVSLKNLTMSIYKEAFLWLGEAIKAFTTGLKKPQLDELDAYYKSVDPSQMKLVKKTDAGGKAKALDVYDMVAEAELPKKFNDEAWVDEILATAKWNEKKAKIDELNEFLAKNPKLSPKTNAFNFLNLARRLFMETNIAVQVAVIKTLGFLAAGLRKNFVVVSKTLFPVLLGKLKEKHKNLSEEIILTLEKFYAALTFEETHDDLLEHLKDKNTDKKLNMLKIMLMLVEKLDKVKTGASAVKMVKLVIGLLDENDVNVRDSAAMLIARLKDNFNDKVTPLLSDLSSVKMSKITNFSTNQSTIVSSTANNAKTAPAESNAKVDPEQPGQATDKRRTIASMSKDKSQMIAEMRENLFSNKTIKVSDVKAFSGYLNTTLKNLLELTKEFKEVSSSQAKEILILIQEIANRVDRGAFPEDSRKIIIQFYIEQLLSKSSDEIFESMDQLVYHQSKIVTPKVFLVDIFDVVGKKSIKVSRELLVAVLKIVDKEVAGNSQLAMLPHKQFIDFLKINFAGQSIHSSFRAPLLNTIRTYGKKFGEKCYNDFPSGLIKELESQSGEAQKAFVKTFDKLNDKNPEKKRLALVELANYDDPAKILLFWTNNDFLSFLKRSLLMDIRAPHYGALLTVVSRYLNLYKECPNDFSVRSYLFAFHSILVHYFDRKEGHKYSQEFETLIRTSISTLGATTVMNEFISDANALTGWKEQILNFYFSFSGEIETSIRFMNYLISIVGLKGPANDIRPLVDSVLLLLKNTTDDEIILKGNENKYIREVWQKNEEDLLINENFVRGYKVFEEPRSFQVVKNFIGETLKMDEGGFHSPSLEQHAITENDGNLKIKLAYFYLRSIENLPRINEFFLNQLKGLNRAALDNISLFIALKIAFQILKNLFYAQADQVFLDAKDLFDSLVQQIPFSFEEMFRILDFSNQEAGFFQLLVGNEDYRVPDERDQPTPVKPNARGFPASTMNDLAPPTPMPAKETTSRANPRALPQLNLPQNDNDFGGPGFGRDNLNQNSPKSQISTNKRPNPATSAKPQKIQELSVERQSRVNFPQSVEPQLNQQFMPGPPGSELENPLLLQEKFSKMLSYNLEEFHDASEYFKALCRAENPSTVKFLHTHANDVISVFVEVASMVFQEGINYELERSSYELIFVPFQQLCAVDQLLASLHQQVLNSLTELVLFRLVASNEEKTVLEQNEEDQAKQDLAGFMVKFWNSIMLRIIENAEPNLLLASLFALIVSAQDYETNRLHQSIYNLAFKCMIRITRNLKNIIAKIDPRVVLGLIFNYIQTFGVRNSESLGSKSIKTLLNELVNRSDPDYIWNCYYETFGEQGEPHISKWIRIIQARNGREGQRGGNQQDLERELYEIIQEINKQSRISQIAVFMNDVKRILEEEPAIDIRAFADAFANKSYFEYVLKELRATKSPQQGSFNATVNNGPSKQNSLQGIQNFNSTSSKPQVGPPAQQRQAPQSTKKSPLNLKKPKNIDEVLNQSDLSDASQLFKKADGRNRYNFN